MTGRQLCDLRNNPRVCGHTLEHFEEMASCIKASEKHNALCGAVYRCGRAAAASPAEQEHGGTAEAERARSAASGRSPGETSVRGIWRDRQAHTGQIRRG